MKLYAKILEIPEGKAKAYVPRFQREAQYVEVSILTTPQLIANVDSSLSCISFIRKNEIFYGLVENTSLKSIIK